MKKKIYGPSNEAIENPVRVQIPSKLDAKPDEIVPRTWVGVGADIKLNRRAPKKQLTVKEATPEQYKWMYESGRFPNLVIVEDGEEETTNVAKTGKNDKDK